MSRRLRFAIVAVGLCAVTRPIVLVAQAAPAHAAGLRGVVIDAANGQPLEGATVALEALPAGVVVAGAAGGFLASSRQVATAADGAYSFVDIAPGTYRLRVIRLGYGARSIEVHYEGVVDPRVSVGLELAPLELEPLEVVAPRSTLTAGLVDTPAEDERIRQARLRQATQPSPDARMITAADLLEATTLAETDLLRALQRLPGVTGEDDWSAEPWTRGSQWDETRVYFDGLPLLDPMRFGGAFTAISPDAVGSMTFHPGVRPVDVGGASAGVVDLTSRRAAAGEHIAAIGQLSVLSARFSADRSFGRGNGITVSGRRSYIDEVSTWTADPGDPNPIPYRSTDLAGRWDQALGDSVSLELSGLLTRDRVLGDIPHELKGARGTWGNTAGRATLEVRRFGVRTRLTEGGSRFRSRIDAVPFDPDRADLFEATTGATTRNGVEANLTELTVAPLTQSGEPPSWKVGARWTATDIDFNGPAPWPYPDAANAGYLTQRSAVTLGEYWGQVRKELSAEVDLTAGLKLNRRGPSDPSDDGVVPAPRLALTWTPTPELRVAAAVGRHYQYEQAIAAAGFTFGPALVPGHLWVSARGEVPALRSDIATVGAELWLPGGWLASANAYVRGSTGRLTPSPDSGYVRARPPVVGEQLGDGWTTGRTMATGVELGARRLAGRWTGSAAYSLTRARMTAGGVTYTAPGERTHALDLTFAVRASRNTTVGGALTAATGAAYTRFYAFRCTEISWYCPAVDAGELPVVGFAEPAGTGRAPAYVSLDLQVERTGRLWGLPFGLYGQLRNALARDNRAAYLGSILACDDSLVECSLTDRFDDGFPMLPLVGFWIRM